MTEKLKPGPELDARVAVEVMELKRVIRHHPNVVMDKHERDLIVQRSPGQCPGGFGCTCCGAGCDCGCRDDCQVFRLQALRRPKWVREAVEAEGK